MLRGEKQQRGFTLIELMVVLAIAVIVVTLSTPLSSMFQQNRVSSQVRAFAGALNLARSTAITEGTCTSLCISDGGNPADCKNTTADETIEAWNDGWLVFTDANCDATIDVGDDTLLLQFAGLPEGYTLRIESTDDENKNDRETITYQPSGLASSSAGTWTLCAPSGRDDLKRGIDISISGRVQSLTVEDANGDENINLADCPA
jgi:type IV fimbrial biogenesis protein FimT